MPKQTFFNLPEEKRQAFITSAIDEFAENDFDSASISRLLAQLGIAKGSFYQYFEDKQDLYFYLIDFVMKERMNFIRNESGDKNKADYFQFVQDLLETGVRYDLAFPKQSQLLHRALIDKGILQNESINQFKASLLEGQREVIALGISMGMIDPDLDPELIAQFLNAVMADFGRNMITTTNTDPNMLHGQIRQIIHIIFKGISVKGT